MRIDDTPTELVFYRVLNPDGTRATVGKQSPKDWPAHIAVSPEFLAASDPEYVSSGDGMLRITPSVGTSALYGQVHAGDRCIHYDLIGEGEDR